MAKYISVNELDKFKLHDAKFISSNIQNNKMIWTLENANVTTENSQNNFDCDMRANEACFIFYDFYIKTFELAPFEHYDYESGKLHTIRPRESIPASEYEKTIQSFTENVGWISDHTKCNENSPFCHSYGILTITDSYELIIEYSKIIAEWDSFISKAWYVDWDKK